MVVNGQTVPGKKHTLHCDAYTTWTPADVTVAQKKGGFVRLASTAEFTQQMPCVMIIDAAWADAHRPAMCSMIKALGLAGDQVRSFPEAQQFAAKVSALVYKDKDANYWLKYFRGSTEADRKGNQVFLGGSQSFNLADAAMVFGLGNEKTPIDRYRITYETFGSILTKLWPVEMKGSISYDEMVDNSYLKEVLTKNDSLRNGKTESSSNEYASGNAVTEQVSEKAYNIKYAVGSAIIDKSSYHSLDEIFKSGVISEKLTLFIYGHTDALGDDKDNGASNQALSMRRAESVQAYLVAKGFPSNRIQVNGYGSGTPIPATNGNKNDVRNRCVEIIQGH